MPSSIIASMDSFNWAQAFGPEAPARPAASPPNFMIRASIGLRLLGLRLVAVLARLG